MNFPFFIARRYFLSKKKKNFINVISIISMLVVGVGTMALIIVLSVFNGLEGLLRSTYGSFDPDIVISAKSAKSFEVNDSMISSIEQIPGIAAVTQVVEDNVLLKYKNAQRVVRLKGVSDNFIDQGRLARSIVYGDFKLKNGDVNYAIVGRGVQFDLSINPNNDFYTLQVYYPKNISPGAVNPTNLYNVQHVLPSGVFAIEKYYDENYVFVPLDFAVGLLNYKEKRTSFEITVDPSVSIGQVRSQLSSTLGEEFTIKSGDELHADIYKIMKWEKLIVFLTFSLIIGIASINIYFSLTMLAIDKQKDIAVLTAQGAPKNMIRNIFIQEGMIIAFSGAGVGLVIGLVISLLQQEFGFVSMGLQSGIVDAYPVKVDMMDVIFTSLSIITITIIASVQPARMAVKNLSITSL